ncbi:MAG: hypothetical protein IJ420_09965 [Lachnospiraceae bacterium]|nr:hypothetical protein [Lachnospiraceae bacterium]
MNDDASLMIHAVNEQHILYYTVSKHLNTAYEEGELYEYGIKCALCDKRGRMMDEKDVKCVSPNFNFVRQLTNVLARYEVYPVHLLEILDDLMNRDKLPEDDNLTSPLLCV